MMPRLDIDYAEPPLIDELLQLENKCFTDPWTRGMFLSAFADENGFLLVAKADGCLVGYIVVSVILDEVSIDNIAVSPELRRCGIAEQLIDSAEENVKGFAAFITLEVRESNSAAISLYEKKGFLKVGFRKKYYSNPEESAVIMTKLL